MMRALLLGLAGICVFAVVAVAMLQIMPGPLKPSDYLVIGSVATLVALLVLFLTVVKSTRPSNLFFTKRKKPGAGGPRPD